MTNSRHSSGSRAPRALRALAILAVTLTGLTCRDRALTGPGVVQHGSLAIAPRFAAVPEGGPVITLTSVSAWLVPLSGIGDSTQVTATFNGDSAVLQFEVPLTGPTQQFILRITGFGAGGVALYRAVDTVTIAAGNNPPVTGVPMVYVGADAGVTDITVLPNAITLVTGDTLTLAVTALAGDAPFTGTVLLGWTSRDLAAVTVSPTGKLTAGGTQRPPVWVVARTVQNIADSALVTVNVSVASVTLNLDAVTIARGDTLRLVATPRDVSGAAIPRPVSWTSLDPAFAVVDTGGLVQAMTAGGSARIVASSGGKADTAIVTATARAVAAVVIAPRDTPLAAGQTATFTAAVTDAQGNPNADHPLTWTSRTPAVATVTLAGVVTAVAPGTSYLVATAGGVSDSVLVTVSAIPVASVVVTPASDTLTAGDTATFAAATFDARGNPLPGRLVAWSTLDANVATVSSAGLVTAVAAGATSIIATSEGQADTAAVLVLAGQTPIARIAVAPAEDSVFVGDSVQFTATAYDALGRVLTGRTFTWTTLDGQVASVSATGYARGLAAGTTTVIAGAEGQSDSATVVVVARQVPVASIVITPQSDTVAAGDSALYVATTYDALGNVLPGRAVVWATLNAAVAAVLQSGWVHGVSSGAAGITATSEGVSDTAQVLVTGGQTPITSTTISPRADTLSSLGDTARFTATSDAGGQPRTGTYTWASRNDAVATVSTTGVVTATGNGTTYIVVTEAGGTRDSATVLIQQRVSSVSVTPQTVTRYLGKQQLFAATAVDGRGNPMAGASFTWSSSVPTVASVDASGNASMLALGSTNIIATASGISGQAALTVITPITRIAVRPDSVTLTALGATQGYLATAYDTLDAPMTGVRFTFISSNPSVASLGGGTDTTTVATASANGTTFVRASAQGVTGGAFLTVSQVLATIELTPLGTTISPTGRAVLTARGRDANGYYISMAQTAFRWVSDAPTIATVDNQGLVTATGAGQGTANITAELASDPRFVSNRSVITVSNTGVGNRIFFGRDTLAIGRASSNSIPLYLSDTRTVPIIITLVARDTIAYFPQMVDTFPAGSNAINVQLNGRNAGVTELYVTGDQGYSGDTAVVLVQANVRLSGGGFSMVANDQRNDQVLLSDPAPTGGVYVTYSYTTAGVVSISPDPAFIPAGQLAANIVVRGVAAGTTTVTPMASGVNGQSAAYTISPAVLTIASNVLYLGLGQYQDNATYVYTPQYISTALPVTITSSDTLRVRAAPTLVTIPSNSNYAYFSVRGFGLGQATVRATASGWTPDSVSVIVTTPQLELSGGGNLTTTSPTQTIYAYTADSVANVHNRLNSLVVSASSSDTTVIRLLDTLAVVPSGGSSIGFRLRAVGGGSAWVRVTAGGHRPDSVFYTVAAPKLSWAGSTAIIGTEQQRPNFSYVYTPDYLTAPLVITVTSADSTIAATETTDIIPTGSNYVYLDLRGHRPGTAQFIVTAPGYTPDTISIRVSSSRITACCDNGAMRMFQPDATLSVYAQDTVGNTNNTLVALRVSMTSTNTQVIAVDSAAVTIGAGSSQNSQARIRAVGGGSAAVIVTTPGYAPDTVFYTVVTPKINFSAASHVIGARQSQANMGYVYTPDYVTAPLVVRLTRRRPDLVQFADSLVIPANNNYLYYDVSGLATGVDTVIAAAAGYSPDTLVIRVSSARLVGANPPANVATTAPPANLYVVLADSLFTGHASLDRLTIRVQSTDTNVVQLDSQYVHILPGQTTSANFPARWVGAGTARVVYSDSAGLIPPDTSTTVAVTGPALRVSGTLSYLGTRQRLDGPYVYTDNTIVGQPLVVRLSSSRPDIVQVPDSAIIPVGSNYVYFNAYSLDTIARIRVTITATGYQPTSMEIEVGQSRLLVSTAGTVNTTTPQQSIYVEAQDHRGSAHPVTQDLVVNLSSTNSAVASPDSSRVTIRAGNAANSAARMRYSAVGTTTLVASDPRTGVLYPYVPDSVTVNVNTPLLATAGMPGSIGIGQYADPYVYVPDYTTTPLTVTFTHNAALLDLPATAVIPTNNNYVYFRVSGKASGTDTVKTSAPGHVTETRIVGVGPGLIGLESFPSTLAIGDSIAIRLYTMDPAGGGRAVLATETFSLASTPQVTIVSGGASSVPISSITVAAGQSYSGYFYLKGASSGTGSVTASNAGRYITSNRPLVVP